MDIEIRARHTLSPDELGWLADMDRQVFGTSGDGYTWSATDWHVLVRMDGQWVSQVGIVERTGAVNGQPVKLGGIGGVGTLLAWRKRGLAEAAMRQAAEFMRDQLRVEFGLLICDHKMVPYYRRLGWQVVEGPLQFDQPKGQVTFTEPVMILPCNTRDWLPGVIDLCGLPW